MRAQTKHTAGNTQILIKPRRMQNTIQHTNKLPCRKGFPQKLYQLLQASSSEGYDHIISWRRNKTSFQVWDQCEFVRTLMGKHFRQTKYKSFQRQLNIYGFQRLPHGEFRGAYFHPYLVSGRPDLCDRIHRLPQSPKRTKQQQPPNVPPIHIDCSSVYQVRPNDLL